MKRRTLLLVQLTLGLGLAACGSGSKSGAATSDEGDGTGAAGAPSDGPPDTLFPADAVNSIEEGSYFLTGEGRDLIDVTLLVSFEVAMHVEMTLEGGTIDEVTGWPADDRSAAFAFDFPSTNRPEWDFSAGAYQVNFLAHDVDGEYRIDLHATPLGGSEL